MSLGSVKPNSRGFPQNPPIAPPFRNSASIAELKKGYEIFPRKSENISKLEDLGGTKTYNHYSNGWAMAFNTPFKMWKRYEFNGGTSDPCIISVPKAKAHGEIRHQYCHAIDLVPTILDVRGVDATGPLRGVSGW